MEETEFVKRFGLEDARGYLCGASFWEIDGTPITPCVNGLKRVVESYEVVERFGGLVPAKKFYSENYMAVCDAVVLKRAIADVESCT